MTIDHIFIFVTSKKEADAFVDFGLKEGSGNVHKGIGTANRRFFFENFYLEILWVENEEEAKSVSDIGIWERYNYKHSHYSRFGVCFTHTEETDSIFKKAIKWKPQFIQDDGHVDIVTSKKLPWIFRFPPNRQKKLQDEPKEHRTGLKRLSKATFFVNDTELSETFNAISKTTNVLFQEAITNTLVLEFDQGINGKTKTFKNLDLVINY